MALQNRGRRWTLAYWRKPFAQLHLQIPKILPQVKRSESRPTPLHNSKPHRLGQTLAMGDARLADSVAVAQETL